MGWVQDQCFIIYKGFWHVRLDLICIYWSSVGHRKPRLHIKSRTHEELQPEGLVHILRGFDLEKYYIDGVEL